MFWLSEKDIKSIFDKKWNIQLKPVKTVLLISLALLLAAPAASYDSGTDSTSQPETACNDGKDNDNDGKTDSDDSGCTRPYYKDNSEGDVFDRDATTAFKNSIDTTLAPSVFRAAAVHNNKVDNNFKDTKTSNGKLKEYYVKNADKRFGGGEITSKTVSPPDSAIITTSEQKSLLVNRPSDLSNDKCGDGLRTEGSTDTQKKTNCPEDYGMKDVILDDSLSTVNSEYVKYTLDMRCQEMADNQEINIRNNPPNSITVSAKSPTENPDYVRNTGSIRNTDDNDKILRVDCATSGKTLFQSASGSRGDPLTDYDLDTVKRDEVTSGTATVYDDNLNGSSGKSTYSYCKNSDEVSAQEDALNKLSNTISHTVQIVSVGQADGGTAGQRQTQQTSSKISLTVKKNGRNVDGGSSYTYCSNTKTITGYDDCKVTNPNSKKSCSSTTVDTVDTDQTFNEGYTTNTVDVYHPNYVLTSVTQYNVNTNDAVGTVTEGDSSYDNSNFNFANGAFFTDDSSKENDFVQGNDPAVSRSKFKINVENGNFVAERDVFQLSDADGPRGRGDGYIAIDDKPSTSGNPVKSGISFNTFGQETSNTNSNDFISSSQVGTPSCPSNTYYCLLSIDLRTKSSGWSDPTSRSSWTHSWAPSSSSGPEPVTTKETWGSCMFYQYMAGYNNVDCTEKVKEVCGDNVDNDRDGKVDENPPCTSDSSSISDPQEQCDNEVDDDGDGTINEGCAEYCGDGLDNDQDGLTDENCGSIGGPRQTCGDEPNEFTTVMEGPEVNQNKVDGTSDARACADDKTDCVVGGNHVNEGTVRNIAPDNSNTNYEKGGNSPDREICLAISRSKDPNSPAFSDADYNTQGEGEEHGGEWYDLDSEEAENYLRNEGINRGLIDNDPNNVVDSNGDGNTNQNDIDNYIRRNKGQFHPEYNPGARDHGDSVPQGLGITVEDDCGPALTGCDDSRSKQSGKEPVFYSFLNAGKRDEDYNPDGNQNEGSLSTPDAFYTGYVVKTHDFSDQLQNTGGSATIWNRSQAKTGTIDRYAIAQNQTVAVSTRGRIFKQGSTYLNKDYTKNDRQSKRAGDIEKKTHAFGNSYAAVLNKPMEPETPTVSGDVPEGRGIWIDPDFLRAGFDNVFRVQSSNVWHNELNFRMDLTGPDSGLGFDTPSLSDPKLKDPNKARVVRADIYWEGESGENFAYKSNGVEDTTTLYGPDQDNTNQNLEPPMCGDDENEYLFEQAGESPNSSRYTGAYACVSKRTYCVYTENGETKIVDTSKNPYLNTGEPDEDEGRFKQDKETCVKRPGDAQAFWFDQDYGDTDGDGVQNTCNVNNLYGELGKRWFPKEYVQQYPFAVTGGIDDDFNDFLQTTTPTSQIIKSRPSASSWSSGTSPVPTGTEKENIATKGFCGGDDGSEYLATQICRTDVCKTKRSHFGVSAVQGACVYDGRDIYQDVPQPSDPDNQKRKIYEPGQTIKLNYDQPVEIICVQGSWYRNGPIVFNKNVLNVPFGESNSVGFQVINLDDTTRTYNIKLLKNDAARFASFTNTQENEFQVTLNPKQTENYEVEVRGIKQSLTGKKVRVRAVTESFENAGTDEVTLQINTQNSGSGSKTKARETESVPGITGIQILILVIGLILYRSIHKRYRYNQ